MTSRRVEHVMGMPISLALRGRHAGDARGDAAWAAALAVLRDADRMFSTYRADSVISRINRGEIAVDTPARGRRGPGASAPRPSATSGGAFAAAPRRRARPVRRRQGLGRRARRRPTRRSARHRLLPVRGRRPHLPHRRPGRRAVAHRHRGPAGPDPDRRGRARSAPAPSRRPAPPTAAPTSSTPAPVARRAASRPSPCRALPHRRRRRRHRRLRPRRRRRALAGRTRAPRRVRRARRTGRPARSDVRPSHLRRTADLPLPFTVGSATATANPLRPVNPGAGGSYRSGT